jgi:hypothetical protein
VRRVLGLFPVVERRKHMSIKVTKVESLKLTQPLTPFDDS